jgi:hypothetical protein
VLIVDVSEAGSQYLAGIIARRRFFWAASRVAEKVLITQTSKIRNQTDSSNGRGFNF